MKLTNTKLQIESIARDLKEYGVVLDNAQTTNTIVEVNKKSKLLFWVGSQTEYDKIVSKNNLTLYLVTS